MIRKISALLILVVLALSITPVTFVHSVAADHQDTSCELPGDHYCEEAINCKCLDLVADGLFFSPNIDIDLPTPMIYGVFTHSYIHTFTHSPLFSEALRG